MNWKVLSPWNYCGDSWFRRPDSARAVRAKVAPSETAAPEVTKHVLKGHNHRLVHMATRAGPSCQALHTHHQNCYMATAKNIRLGSHTQTHTRSIPRSIGYGSKGGCVIQALGSHNHHHHYYNHLCCHHSFCYCHCTCHLLLLLQQLYCCCYCYSLLSPVLPPPQI